MVLASGGILTVSLAISTLLTVLDPLLRVIQPQSAALLNIIDLLISFAIVTVLFAVIYRILPETRVTWRDVWLGALSASTALHRGQVRAESLSDVQQHPHGLRRSQFVCGGADLDLLLGADLLVRRRGVPGVCRTVARNQSPYRNFLTTGRYDRKGVTCQ